jgi:energy-coupling factor transporter transmembrane protein EcfT
LVVWVTGLTLRSWWVIWVVAAVVVLAILGLGWWWQHWYRSAIFWIVAAAVPLLAGIVGHRSKVADRDIMCRDAVAAAVVAATVGAGYCNDWDGSAIFWIAVAAVSVGAGTAVGGYRQTRNNGLKGMWWGVWIWGGFGVIYGLVVFGTLGATVGCATLAASSMPFQGCSEGLANLYLVLKEFSTGVGAAFGLLGVAWSTFYKAALDREAASRPSRPAGAG